MCNIIFRKIKKKDYPYIKHMMNHNFYLYEYIEDKRILNTFLNSYLYNCLAEQTFTMVAEKEGKVIGVIMGNAKEDYKLYKSLIYILKGVYYNILTGIKAMIYNTNIKQYKGITLIYKKLMLKADKKFDGILTLFVVSKDYQGYGVGKNLLKFLFEYQNKNNVKNMYVFTDSKCNYKFYDSKGFKRLGQDTFNVKTVNKQFDLEIFLYEYDF